MDTDSFLNPFLKMVSPEVMFSDNGGSFVKADKEFQDLMNHLD